MSEGRVERRLAAILAADVVGYSRLMGEDEAGTLTRVKTIRRDLIDPKVAEHKGRIVKTTGDGILIEFPSVVEAVACAMAIQQEMAQHNIPVAQDQRIEFRVGINLGDVIVDGDDIHGDGVNVAARLEAFAEPGSICISGIVHDQVQGRLDLRFEDAGEQSLKNIARPIRVYRVQPNGVKAAASASRALVLPDKPSLAVMSFDNMSSELELEFFADGIAEDVITALSRCPSLFVIARNSSFTYKGRAVDVKQIGRNLGVRYVLEGSLRKAGERIRVTAQLIEAETGNHLWAERYDRALSGIFAVQDEITEAVAIAVAPTIDAAERLRALRKPPDNVDAWGAYQQGLWHLAKVNAEANDQARVAFERSIRLDPTFAPSFAGLSLTYGYASIHYRTTPWSEAAPLNSKFARKAVELDPANAYALAASSLSSAWHGDLASALQSAQKAVTLSPSFAWGRFCLGIMLIFMGQRTEGREELSLGLRINPNDQEMALNGSVVFAQSYYFDRDYERCIEACENRLRIVPGYPLLSRLLVAGLAQLGRVEEAKAALAGFEKAVATLGISFSPAARSPWHRQEDHQLILEGLRKAGWTG
jgi:adenylate cyclase